MQFRRDLGKAQAHLYSVWKKLFDGRNLPFKKSIGIRELRHFTANYAIIHFNDNNTLSYLHSGTAIDELWGRNVAGLNLASLFSAESQQTLTWFMQNMIMHPCGGHSEELFAMDVGDRYQLDTLYLPIKKTEKEIALALIADVRVIGPTDFLYHHNQMSPPAQIVQYVDFIDVGFGVPAD